MVYSMNIVCGEPWKRQ